MYSLPLYWSVQFSGWPCSLKKVSPIPHYCTGLYNFLGCPVLLRKWVLYLIVVLICTFLYPRSPKGVYCFTSVCLSVRPSKIFFSVTVDGRNLIFGHKLHIGNPYRVKRFWTHQIPTSCLPILLIFIHILTYICICTFF